MRDLLMAIRDAFHRPPEPQMSEEQVLVAERLRKIADRQRAIDIQVSVLQASRADAKRRQ
jgi:hypothetical protein